MGGPCPISGNGLCARPGKSRVDSPLTRARLSPTTRSTDSLVPYRVGLDSCLCVPAPVPLENTRPVVPAGAQTAIREEVPKWKARQPVRRVEPWSRQDSACEVRDEGVHSRGLWEARAVHGAARVGSRA